MKHTPGPYILNVTDKAIESHPGFIRLEDSEGNLIALIANDNTANALLFFSAPELFKALENIISYEERGRKKGEPRISEHWYQQCKSAILKARQHEKTNPS